MSQMEVQEWVEKSRTKGRQVLKYVCMDFDCNELRLAMRLISLSETEEVGADEMVIGEGKKRCKNGRLNAQMKTF
jgi:hypothetical protein